MIIDILRGLAYLHSNNMYHGDVKLENIVFKVIDNVSTFKLTDFESISPGFTADMTFGTASHYPNEYLDKGFKIITRDLSKHIIDNWEYYSTNGVPVDKRKQRRDLFAFGFSLLEIANSRSNYKFKSAGALRKHFKCWNHGYTTVDLYRSTLLNVPKFNKLLSRLLSCGPIDMTINQIINEFNEYLL